MAVERLVSDYDTTDCFNWFLIGSSIKNTSFFGKEITSFFYYVMLYVIYIFYVILFTNKLLEQNILVPLKLRRVLKGTRLSLEALHQNQFLEVYISTLNE